MMGRGCPILGLRHDRSRANNSAAMTEKTVTLRLNQQQLELLDRTIAQGVAPDRVSLVRLALREYAAKRDAGEGAAR
jgi:Flp pilus assembly protein CpaB